MPTRPALIAGPTVRLEDEDITSRARSLEYDLATETWFLVWRNNRRTIVHPIVRSESTIYLRRKFS